MKMKMSVSLFYFSLDVINLYTYRVLEDGPNLFFFVHSPSHFLSFHAFSGFVYIVITR